MMLSLLSSGYNTHMKHWKYLVSILIVLISSQLAPVFAQALPEFVPELQVRDLSEQLPESYLADIEQSLQQYTFPVRVVYLPDTVGVNLGQYAARLFRHWRLPEDSLLLVVALDRRKMGVHAGTELKTQLKAETQDQEVALPSASPVPGVTPDPTLPLDVSSEFDHLELIPEAIDQITHSMQEQPESQRKPSTEPILSDDNLGVEQERSLPRRQFKLEPGEWLVMLGLALGLLLGVGGWFGLLFWRRWRKTQELMDKYSLQGQVVYEQLEQVYADLEAVMPDFHGYLGETEKTLSLFLKSMHSLQETYETLFDAFDEEIAHLGQRESREEAIVFFQELELKLEEGKQLHEQAFNVLKNLKDVRQSNQQLFAQSEQKRQAFSQEISETRKLHPALKLKRIQQIYQQRLQELQRLDKQNERDPLGVEKALKEWRKQLSKLEQETRSLPHLWQQFSQDLKQRIQQLRERLQKQGTPAQSQTLAEIEKMHRTLMLAIQEGDLSQLDRWNERFTRKLQELEAEV